MPAGLKTNSILYFEMGKIKIIFPFCKYDSTM